MKLTSEQITRDLNIFEMEESLKNATSQAGGRWAPDENTTVKELIAVLATNGVRFYYDGSAHHRIQKQVTPELVILLNKYLSAKQ